MRLSARTARLFELLKSFWAAEKTSCCVPADTLSGVTRKVLSYSKHTLPCSGEHIRKWYNPLFYNQYFHYNDLAKWTHYNFITECTGHSELRLSFLCLHNPNSPYIIFPFGRSVGGRAVVSVSKTSLAWGGRKQGLGEDTTRRMRVKIVPLTAIAAWPWSRQNAPCLLRLCKREWLLCFPPQEK